MNNIKILLLLIGLLSISCCKNVRPENSAFTKLQRQEHLQNRQDSTTWDTDLFKTDIEDDLDEKLGPFTLGTFPNPKYDLIGKGAFQGLTTFTYNGNGVNVKKIEDKTILFNSFFVKNNKLNKKRLKDKKDNMFFQIIVLTDTIDSLNHTHEKNFINSRNHPDYIGQGFYKTKYNQIDYTAFVTAEQNAYAIINTRIFDLKYGKTILIAPQKDKSLRSLQIKTPIISSEEINSYTDSLLEKLEIIHFFTKHGNI